MSLFKSILKIVAIVLMIIAIVYCFAALAVASGVLSAASLSYLTFGGFLALSSWGSFLLVAGALATLAYVISPDGAGEVARAVADAVTGVASAAGSVLGGVATGVIGGVVSSVSSSSLGTVLIAVGVGIVVFNLLGKKKSEKGVEYADSKR